MKKYLLTSAAALAFCGLFTSCTHDFDNDGGSAAQNSVMKTYEQAFVTAFGQPDPNQEWGFGSSTVAATRGGTRVVPGITFPTFKDGDCPDMPTKYYNTVAEVEANVSYFTGDVNNKSAGDVFYIDSNSTLSNTQNRDNLTIYVIGNVTYLGSTSQNNDGTTFCVTEGSTLKLGKVCERLTIYLARNATLDISERLDENGNKARETIYPDWNGYQATTVEPTDFTFTKENAALYMSAGSKVKGSNIYFKDGYTVVNEGDSIKADELHVENGAILYNKQNSVVKTTGVIALRNTNGEIDNFGTMEGASMTLDANARFYNVAGGNVTITGLTKINNDGGYNAWQNSGQFNTGSFEILGGCQDPAAFNNCHMSVTNKFFMNQGNFVLDGGAAVECGSFEWKGNNYFHMGGKALLKVTGELLANNQNTGYGFYGDATDYAVIQAGSIEKGSKGKFRAAYFGNLFIDTDSHFTQGESSADGTWYTFGDNVKFSFTDNTDVSGYQTHGAKTAKKDPNFSITIPADPNGCTPGYGDDDDDDDPDPDAIRVICEDLSVTQASDWDFNDAVFDVKLVENNSKVQITLRAAGGTLLLNVAGREVHELFKEFNPNADPAITSTSMVSTGSTDVRGKYTNINLNAPVFTIDNNFGTTDVKEIAKAIPVQVFKLVNGVKDWFDIEWRKGEPSARIGVGTDYNWCDERTDIRDQFKATYSGNEFSTFKMYVRGILSDGWYNTTTVNQQQVNAYTGQ